MLTEERIREIIADVTCPIFPSWKLDVYVTKGSTYLQVRDPEGICVVTGDPLPWGGRKWQLSYYMTETELVLTAFKAWEAAIAHEFHEHFRYRGVQVFDPHRSIQSLLTLDGQRDTRE